MVFPSPGKPSNQTLGSGAVQQAYILADKPKSCSYHALTFWFTETFRNPERFFVLRLFQNIHCSNSVQICLQHSGLFLCVLPPFCCLDASGALVRSHTNAYETNYFITLFLCLILIIE